MTRTDDPTQVEQFERHRPRLRSIAYRMLGAWADADDAVQECWIRYARTESAGVDNAGGWLTTAVSRVCLSALRSRGRRRETFTGGGFEAGPIDPLVRADPAPTPEQEAEISDAVGLALMVVLKALSPAERVAFVLHDMFDVFRRPRPTATSPANRKWSTHSSSPRGGGTSPRC